MQHVCVCCLLYLQTPSLLLVQHFCADAADWLAQHPHNVVVVHCKAGKGRTGLMICCLLMYLYKNAPELANLSPPAAASAEPDPLAAGLAAGKVLGRTMSDLSVPSSHDALSSSSTMSTRQGPTGAVLLRSKSVPAYNSGWHPWQHVEPVQLQQLSLLVQDVLELYAERRTHDGNGVTIASQRR